MTAYPVPLNSIIAFVITLHLALLGWILWFAPVATLPIKPKKFAVQTVQLHPKTAPAVAKKVPELIAQAPKAAVKSPEKEPVKESIKEPVQKVEQKPTPKPVPKPTMKPAPKVNPKPAIKKEPPKPISKPSTQQAPQKKPIPAKEALAAVKQKLASMPAFVTASNTVSGPSETTFDYEEGLVARLRILLKLPEMGDVRVALTLNRQGKVIKTEILTAANQANKKAIELHLPAIQFPPFGQAFPGETTHQFTLTLTNL